MSVGYDDPRRQLTRPEAAQELRISVRTLDRISEDQLPRQRPSPGRVTYRLGDIRKLQGRGLDGIEPAGAIANYTCLPCGGEYVLSSHGYDDTIRVVGSPARIGIIRELDGLAKPTKIHLRPANEISPREIMIFDIDGVAGEEPILILPTEGELLGGARLQRICKPFGTARLTPFVAPDDRTPDCWAFD